MSSLPENYLNKLSSAPKLTLFYRALLSAISGLMLAWSFLYSQLFLLTWIALIPFLIALQKTTLRQAYLLGLICGLFLSVASSYWIDDFIYNLKGYSVPIRFVLSLLIWVYSAHLLVLVAVGYVWVKQSLNEYDYITFPLIITAVFSAYPLLFPVQLGATQSSFPIALQAIEYTGVFGLDLVIALTNVLLWKISTRTKSLLAPSLTLSILGCWFLYGAISLSQHQSEESLWKTQKIGFVQTNEKPSIDIPPPAINYSRAYPPEMEISEKLSKAGAKTIIWPETRFKGYFQESHVNKAFKHQAKTLQTALIFQDIERTEENGTIKKFNSSVFIDATGQESATYQKRKLVAFGEYLPFFSENETIKLILKQALGDFFSDYTPGAGAKIFDTEESVFLPLICYEALFASFVANSIPKELRQRHKVLLVQSNDSWFGDTRQPYQHLNTSILRSVENRLPMIYVTNNGPSAVVLPSGTTIFKTPFNETGGYLIDLPYSERQTMSFFSIYPRAFISSVYLFSIFLFLTAMIKRLPKYYLATK